MRELHLEGGQPVSGEIRLAGAKNAATKLMIASLLSDEESVLENVPRIGDTEITRELCETIGAEIDWQGPTLRVKTPVIKGFRATELTRRNRIPILAVPPLLHRAGQAEVVLPSGDKIGTRPIDFHLAALRQMGAKVDQHEDVLRVSADKLRGTSITLLYPSVGATENIILAAVLAEGRTFIKNAAVEPEIFDLIKFLQKMGAIIEPGTDRRLYIEGVKKLHGARHKILPDRNEAVSFAALALATGGKIFIRDAKQDDLLTFLNVVRKMDGYYNVQDEGIYFWRERPLRAIEIETDTHPGFMTDWQSLWVVMATQAQGTSVVHETVYEERLGYTSQLKKMGADITVFTKCLGEIPCRFEGRSLPHSAVINGPSHLKGEVVEIPDIRAGLAHVIGALTAGGSSSISGIEHIERGYENFFGKLEQLGVRFEIKS
ncbi:MAG: UDP-N-acetylglucosamine 1-carboxyvinyltransferase [Planctomycetota bacterium]|jgi:UDP-N-acetylglucosamine 1-carboxyvinyltransferase